MSPEAIGVLVHARAVYIHRIRPFRLCDVRLRCVIAGGQGSGVLRDGRHPGVSCAGAEDGGEDRRAVLGGAVPDMIGTMIGRMHHVVLDGPDPAALAAFYSALLGLPVTYRDDDWVVVAASNTSSGLAFQRAPGNQPPTWPDPAIPQQIHLDIMVEDAAAAGPRVLALGAVKLDGPDVYADPAGHPFCLIHRPRWAPPIPEDTRAQ